MLRTHSSILTRSSRALFMFLYSVIGKIRKGFTTNIIIKSGAYIRTKDFFLGIFKDIFCCFHIMHVALLIFLCPVVVTK